MDLQQFYQQYFQLQYYANMACLPCFPIRVINPSENTFFQEGNINKAIENKQNLVKREDQISNNVKSQPKKRCIKQKKSEPIKQRSKKDKDFRIRNQKSTRNIHSNTMKYFTKYVKSFQSSPIILQKLISGIYSSQYTINKFYEDLQEAFSDCRHYINMKKIKSLLTGPNEKFSKILRVLYLRFFKSDKGIFFQYCKKLKNNIKKEHLKDCRMLLKQAFE